MNKKPLFFLDTNIFIYHFTESKSLGLKAKEIVKKIVFDTASGITSTITQTELLSFQMTDSEADKLLALFLEMPNLKISSITQEIAIKAAKIRRQYGFSTPDSIQLAVGIINKADFFVTNDKKLKKCSEIFVKLL